MKKRIYIVCVLGLLLFSGCLNILFPSSGFYNGIYIEGYVFSSVDSSAIRGIQLACFSKDVVYSEVDGFYSMYFSVQTEDYPDDFRPWKVVASDIDGTLNQSFVRMDSILMEDVSNATTHFQLDFYMEPLESVQPD